MAAARPGGIGFTGQVLGLQLMLALGFIIVWEAVAWSGLLFRDVVPSLLTVAGELVRLPLSAEFWSNLGVTAFEVGAALLIGGTVGIVVGIAFGASPWTSKAFEPYVAYVAPVPKIILFPVLLMMFGIGGGSKVAMGAASCFFPIALNTAAGVRMIDRVFLRVGRSFRVGPVDMVFKIYLPAARPALINGLRIGFGVSVIGVLLAETKISSAGIGFMINQAYSQFNMPRMYALLVTVFVLSALINRLMDIAARTR